VISNIEAGTSSKDAGQLAAAKETLLAGLGQRLFQGIHEGLSLLVVGHRFSSMRL
jgi:hypothetical protein